MGTCFGFRRNECSRELRCSDVRVRYVDDLKVIRNLGSPVVDGLYILRRYDDDVRFRDVFDVKLTKNFIGLTRGEQSGFAM